VVVFVLFLVVLRHWAASRAAYGFVIVTMVSIALSAWLDDEAIRADMVLGGLLVLTGVYVGALRRESTPQPPTSTPVDAT
jgi:drug/metabolite transporter (DMT)-like permease